MYQNKGSRELEKGVTVPLPIPLTLLNLSGGHESTCLFLMTDEFLCVGVVTQ
jgi:hypothetical protein